MRKADNLPPYRAVVMKSGSLHRPLMVELYLYLYNTKIHKRFLDLTALLLSIQTLFVVTPCELVNIHKIFKGACCLHLQNLSVKGKFLTMINPDDRDITLIRIPGNHLPVDKWQHHRRPEPSLSHISEATKTKY